MNEVTEVALSTVFMSEAFGTAVLVLLGCGVVANVVLPRTKGNGADWLLISFGWGFAVFAGVYVGHASGAHLNPAVTLGMLAGQEPQYAPGVDSADPAISPIQYTPSPHWPPFLIQCGGAEIFSGGIESMAENFAEHDVIHEFQLWPHQFHVFQVFHPLVPEAKLAVRDIGSFVRGCLRG